MYTSIFELAMFSKMQENASDYNFNYRNAWGLSNFKSLHKKGIAESIKIGKV